VEDPRRGSLRQNAAYGNRIAVTRTKPERRGEPPEGWKLAVGITRFEALWHAWEYLRFDAHTGMSVWFAAAPTTKRRCCVSADGLSVDV